MHKHTVFSFDQCHLPAIGKVKRISGFIANVSSPLTSPFHCIYCYPDWTNHGKYQGRNDKVYNPAFTRHQSNISGSLKWVSASVNNPPDLQLERRLNQGKGHVLCWGLSSTAQKNSAKQLLFMFSMTPAHVVDCKSF